MCKLIPLTFLLALLIAGCSESSSPDQESDTTDWQTATQNQTMTLPGEPFDGYAGGGTGEKYILDEPMLPTRAELLTPTDKETGHFLDNSVVKVADSLHAEHTTSADWTASGSLTTKQDWSILEPPHDPVGRLDLTDLFDEVTLRPSLRKAGER